MKKIKEEKLAPCPKCGSANLKIEFFRGCHFTDHIYEVKCLNCLEKGPGKTYKKRAINAWNRGAKK